MFSYVKNINIKIFIKQILKYYLEKSNKKNSYFKTKFVLKFSLTHIYFDILTYILFNLQ